MVAHGTFRFSWWHISSSVSGRHSRRSELHTGAPFVIEINQHVELLQRGYVLLDTNVGARARQTCSQLLVVYVRNWEELDASGPQICDG